ncbi:YSY6 Protein YSY6 [Candida maltosa Xu316]
MALQTPKQKAANAKFEKKITSQWGKAKKTTTKTEYPVSKSWLFVLLFLVCGGAILELIRLIF